MAWTAPATAVTGNTLTAAFWNAQVRDNMLEVAAATATAAGDLVYADAANSMGSRVAHPGAARMLVSTASSGLAWRQPAEAVNWSSGTSDTTSSTSYSASGFSGSLPSVTVTTGTAAIVAVFASLANNTAGERTLMGYSVSGASSVSADVGKSIDYESSNNNDAARFGALFLQSLTAGSNTFQAVARVTAGTGTITAPRILIIPL